MTRPVFDVHGLQVGYPRRPQVIDDLTVSVPAGFTAVVGPNGCGKSTLLLTLGRLLRPSAGTVSLHGRDLTDYPARDLARTLAFLPQQPLAPDGIRVADLVMRGRQPHRSLLRPPGRADHAAVLAALAATGTTDLADTELAALSGGQRQRVWIAMTLAQDTATVLLDEPTSFLDIAHQVEVLQACADLVASGRSVVAVLHDLGLAARYADHLLVLRDGRLVAAGSPRDVVTADLVHDVFGLSCHVMTDPETGDPLVVPRRTGTSRTGGGATAQVGTAQAETHPNSTTDDRTDHALV